MPSNIKPGSAADVVSAAAAVVSRGWTQKQYARDSLGHIVHPGTPLAVTHCILGGVSAALRNIANSPDEALPLEAAIYVGLRKTVGTGLVGEWNDMLTRTQAEVVQVIEATAKWLAEQEEKFGSGFYDALKEMDSE